MSLATVLSRAQSGVDAQMITIEVHLANGLPAFTVVGLPEAAVRESKDRVRGAIQNSGFTFPNRRITVNLAPADLPKEGARYDLAIALGLLVASDQLPASILSNREFLGELALSGEVRPIRGVFPAALACTKDQHEIIVPIGNSNEVALVNSVKARSINHLLDILADAKGKPLAKITVSKEHQQNQKLPDFIDVKGQEHAKRVLLIAAAGGHNILLIGPPGTGKSMLAERVPSILPEMNEQEAIETATIYSISHYGFLAESWKIRPFRRPHHSASSSALVGGGSIPKPGEISLAHHGVLFLDELPEFNRHVLEVLREPLETGKIHISRAARQTEFLAQFQLIAAMNPCPCGYLGDMNRACTDTPDQVHRYRSKISGPLLDRIDIITEVNKIDYNKLSEKTAPEFGSTMMKQKVLQARRQQYNRQQKTNTQLNVGELEKYCLLSNDCQKMLDRAAKQLNLSMRSYHKVQKLARTIADLEKANQIQVKHLAEAIQLRRVSWNT